MAKPESIKTAFTAPITGSIAPQPPTASETSLAKRLFPTASFLSSPSPALSLKEPYGSGSFQEGNFAFFKPNSDASKKQALFSAAAAAGAPTLCSADGVSESNAATSAEDLVTVFKKAAEDWHSPYDTSEYSMSARFTRLAERVASLFEPIESSSLPPNLLEKIQEVQAALLGDMRSFVSKGLLSYKDISQLHVNSSSQAGDIHSRYSTNLYNFLKRIDDLQTLPARLQQLIEEGRFTAEQIIQLIQSGLNTRNNYWTPEDPLNILERAIDSPETPLSSEPEPVADETPPNPLSALWKLPRQITAENAEQTLLEINAIMKEATELIKRNNWKLNSGYGHDRDFSFFEKSFCRLLEDTELFTRGLADENSMMRKGSQLLEYPSISPADIARRWNSNIELIEEIFEPILKAIQRLKELETIKNSGGYQQWIDGITELRNLWMIGENRFHLSDPTALENKIWALIGHAHGHLRDLFRYDNFVHPLKTSAIKNTTAPIQEAAALTETMNSSSLRSVFKILNPYLRVAGHVFQALGATAVYLDFKETEKSFYATEKEEKLIAGALLFETIGVLGILIAAPVIAAGGATIGGGLFLYKDKVTEDRISKDMNEALRAGRFIRLTQDQNFEEAYFNELALSSDLDDDGIQKLMSKLLSDEDGKKILRDKTVWKKIPQDTLEKIVLLLLDHKAEIKGVDLMPDYVGDDDAAAALFFAARHSDALLRKVLSGIINYHKIDRSDWNEFETLLQTIGIKADEFLPADLAAQMKKESDKNKTFFGKIAGWISP